MDIRIHKGRGGQASKGFHWTRAGQIAGEALNGKEHIRASKLNSRWPDAGTEKNAKRKEANGGNMPGIAQQAPTGTRIKFHSLTGRARGVATCETRESPSPIRLRQR